MADDWIVTIQASMFVLKAAFLIGKKRRKRIELLGETVDATLESYYLASTC